MHPGKKLKWLRLILRFLPDNQAVCAMFILAASKVCEAHIRERDLDSAIKILREMSPCCESTATAVALKRLAGGWCNVALEGFRRTRSDEAAALSLSELRRLSANWPERDEVIGPLGRALTKIYTLTEEAGERQSADKILDELSDLYQRHPKNASVRRDLCNALYNRGILRKRVRDLAAAESALEELGRVGHGDSECAVILAEGLRERFVMAEEAGKTALSDKRLAELRGLYSLYPDKTEVARQFARALCDRILDANKAGDQRLSVNLRLELLELVEKHPDVDQQLRTKRWIPPYGLPFFPPKKGGNERGS